jgi:uncharacterized membrane protein YkvA (DUF1232 family)
MVFGDTASQAAGQDQPTLRRRFWAKFGRYAAVIPFAEDILAAYYCAFDRETPHSVRAVLVGTLTYFVLPADTIPDILPVLGFTDDAAVLAGAIKFVTGHIKPVHREAARAKLEDPHPFKDAG